MIKATKVDGVYSEDPEVNPNANFYSLLKFDEAISKNLKIMDTTALTLARHNNMNIKVFNFKKEDALLKIVNGENLGTLISNG
jgi:uridylate kinase